MLARGLVDASATEPHAGQTALIAAAKAGKVNVMRVLLDADAAVDGTDYKGYTALDNAVPQAPPPSQNPSGLPVARRARMRAASSPRSRAPRRPHAPPRPRQALRREVLQLKSAASSVSSAHDASLQETSAALRQASEARD